MNIEYDTAIPTDEALGRTLRGMTFDKFKVLDNEGVEDLQQQLLESIHAKAAKSEYTVPDADGRLRLPDFVDEYEELSTFRDFYMWKTYGVPDRNLTRDDVIDYMADLVAARQERNVEYGRLTRGQVAALPQDASAALGPLLRYFLDRRRAYEYPDVDSSTLLDTLELDPLQVAKLVASNVLTQFDPIRAPHVYELQSPYYDHWLVGAVQFALKRRTE